MLVSQNTDLYFAKRGTCDLSAQTLWSKIITTSSCIYEQCQRIGRSKLDVVRVFQELLSFPSASFRFVSFHFAKYSKPVWLFKMAAEGDAERKQIRKGHRSCNVSM